MLKEGQFLKINPKLMLVMMAEVEKNTDLSWFDIANPDMSDKWAKCEHYSFQFSPCDGCIINSENYQFIPSHLKVFIIDFLGWRA